MVQNAACPLPKRWAGRLERLLGVDVDLWIVTNRLVAALEPAGDAARGAQGLGGDLGVGGVGLRAFCKVKVEFGHCTSPLHV